MPAANRPGGGGVAPPAQGVPTSPLDALVESLLSGYDWKDHGWGAGPKEPNGQALEALLGVGLRRGTPYALKAALLCLSALPKTEVFDHVEGGFFRACATRKWTEPKPEKGLAQNAAMLSAYAAVFALTGRDEDRRVALETAAFIDSVLSQKEGNLWGAAQVGDDEYFAKMAHRRGLHGGPPVDATVDPAACAATAGAFARAGVCLEEPRLVARGQIALEELIDEGGAAACPAEAAGAAYDLYCATASRAWLGRALGQCDAIEPEPTLVGEKAARASLALQRVGAAAGRTDLEADGRDLARRAGAAAKGLGPSDASLLGALLAAEDGVVLVRGISTGSSQAGVALLRAAVALAVPLGAFGLDAPSPQETNGEPAVRFRVGERLSPPATRPRDLKGAMAGALMLHEDL